MFAMTSETCQLAGMRASVRSFLKATGQYEDEAELIVLALDEACTNIIRYAYEKRGEPIRLEMAMLKDRLRFIFRDYGKACDVAKIRGRALEDFRPGGLGVHLIRQVFDEVEYLPQRQGTKLLMTKFLRPAPLTVPSERSRR